LFVGLFFIFVYFIIFLGFSPPLCSAYSDYPKKDLTLIGGILKRKFPKTGEKLSQE